jgi:plasmid stabilization system protein ParE
MTLSLRPAALEDIREGAAWYEARENGLGLVFIAAVEAQLAVIAATPRRWAVAVFELRKSNVKRFPYSVYFMEVRPDDWVVFGVLHHRQDRVVLRGRQ